MHGEGVYGDRLPKRYEPVATENGNKRLDQIHGFDFAMHDTANNILSITRLSSLRRPESRLRDLRDGNMSLRFCRRSLQAVGIGLDEFVLV
jgi:hypothetical protein